LVISVGGRGAQRGRSEENGRDDTDAQLGAHGVGRYFVDAL
jgi:hypothetical protein